MKKVFLIAAAAALVLSSCSKNEVSENKSESNLIGFSSYSGRSTTKAGDTFVDNTTTSTLPAGKAFGVFAFNTGSTSFDAASHTANFMSDVPVTYDGVTNTADHYTYSPSRYWPSDGANHLLSFFAYYPANNDAITTKVVSGALNTYKYSFAVPVNKTDPANIFTNDPTNQVDFMISDVVKDQQYSTNSGTVPLVFHHMLTQVRFQVTLDADYPNTTITIKGIKLTKINTTGDLTVGAKTDGTVKDNSGWDNQTTAATIDVPVTATALTHTTPATYYTPAKPAATLLMIPQTIDATSKLIITYSYKTDGMTDAIEDTKTVDLASALASWTKNQNVLYSITLGLKVIRFTATVASWDAEQIVAIP